MVKNDGWEIFGVELSERVKEIVKGKGILFVEEISEFENNFFDVIIMWYVLEYVLNLEL